MTISTTKIALSIILIGLSGCASIPSNTEVREQAMEGLPELPDSFNEISSDLKSAPVGWIAAIEDEVLSKLVNEAIDNNPDLMAAQSQVLRAAALAREAGAALSPQIALGSEYETIGEIDESQQTEVINSINISWEIDLWSRLSTQREAALRGYEAVEADYRGYRNLLAASVARAYFVSIEATRQLLIAETLVSSLEEIERIVALRASQGFASERDTALARADLATAQSRLVEVTAASSDALRALEAMIGRYPNAETEISAALPLLPPMPSTGIPSDLLERRPDLVAAERRVAYALGSLEVARVARLPSLVFTAQVSETPSILSGFLDPDSTIAYTSTNLLAPIFTGGALSARVEAAEADVLGALALYRSTAINAFTEVEITLNQTAAVQDRIVRIEVAETQSARAFELARLSYQAGEIGLLEVLIQQQRLLQSQSELVSLERNNLTLYIDLCLALGGDWNSS